MIEVDLATLIGIIAAFISLLLALFIFTAKPKNTISNTLFATFLVLNALEFTEWFTHIFYNEPNVILIAKTLLAYLPMPIFYLYVLSVCYSDFKLKWHHLWHFVPYIIANVIMLPRFYLSDTSQKIKLYETYNTLFEIIFLQVSLHLQSIVYITAGFIVVMKAKKIFIENYANSAIETYKWLFQLLVFLAILYTAALVKNILKYFGHSDSFNAFQIIVGVLVLCLVCWYVLKALRYPSLFKGVNSKLKPANNLVVENKNVQNVNLNRELLQLRTYMETNKPYLDSSLSLKNLASDVQMNSRDLSILINQKLNQHFFDFVNEYRIKEAMEILRNPATKEVTILEILYEVGFNSKSSFNTAFKKYTGKTPSEYRRCLKSNS